jgi:multimeric flavodoxin WrbA
VDNRVASRDEAEQGADMARLLIVHHTPSPNVQAMFEAALAGATTDEIEGVEVIRRPALAATPQDALEADGYLLGTPANLGMMSGALKVFFDLAYYPCLDATRGRPFGLYVHGNNDTTGAVRGIESITTGLGWEKATETVRVTGEPTKDDLQKCWELGAVVAATLMG